MATVDETMMKVQRILTGPMGLRVQIEGDTISVGFSDASTRAFFRVLDFGVNEDKEPRTLVRITAPILRGVSPSPALYEWIARQGGLYFFAHVAVLDDANESGKLFLFTSHTLLGDFLDEEELASAMWGVLGTADDLDDELQKKFGGMRWIDD